MTTYAPRQLLHVDLAVGGWGADATDGRDVQAVLWWHDLPLSTLLLHPEQLPPSAALVDLAARTVAPSVRAWLAEHGITEWDDLARADALARLALDQSPTVTTSVSVIVCTRQRPTELRRCLTSIVACTPAADAVVVVDNAPHLPHAREVVAEFPDVGYIAEPQPGLSRARNAGLRHSDGEVVAFTDDDTRVHPGWIGRIKHAFEDPRSVAVNGLVLPAELDTTAQVFFEVAMGGFGGGFLPRTFGAAFFDENRSKGAPVWRLGAGANMALRRTILEQMGGFDERLGAGAAGCSEDSELWYRLLAAGNEVIYDPSAVVFHYHRRELAALRAQMRAYVRGHVAALFVQFARHGDWGNLRRALLALPWWYAKRSLRDLPRCATGGLSVYPDEVRGYVQALGLLPLAWKRAAAAPALAPPSSVKPPGVPGGGGKASRATFLRQNPFVHPRTEGFFYREKMRAIHLVTPDLSPRRILDIGGGQSGLASLLFPEASVSTVDLDPRYAAAAGTPPNQRFLAADACRLPFHDATFDVVTLFDVLEHIPDDATAVREAWRVLRPGGWALVTSPNERWRFPYYRALAGVCPTDRDMMQEWGHVRRGYRADDLAGLFGSPPLRAATFITPLTVVCHDIAFSRLPPRLRRLLCLGLVPVTWIGYLLHRPSGAGTESASVWRKPIAGDG